MFTELSWIDGVGGRVDSFPHFSSPGREDIFRRKTAMCLNRDSSWEEPGPVSFLSDHPHVTPQSVLSPFSPAVSCSHAFLSFQFPGEPFSLWRHRYAPLDGELLKDPGS